MTKQPPQGSRRPAEAPETVAAAPPERRADGHRRRERPLVYSCSGCSSAAQLANTLAVRLDREELAEMSCIAGVGGGVPSLVKVARSGRPILAIDGCALHCVLRCLESQGVAPTTHVDLRDHGVRKRLHGDATDDEVRTAWRDVVLPAAQRLAEVAEPDAG